MSESLNSVTKLLQDWNRGDPEALQRVFPLVFADLRQMARRHFAREPSGHTLQPTALVSEVFLKLQGQREIQWENRKQFFAVAAMLMRRILVDYAKGRHTHKRGEGVVRVPLEKALDVAEAKNLDVGALDDALSRLGELDPRQARIVELRFFTGLKHEEIAELLSVSVTTVKREWNSARLWLYRELSKK
jgi:RNA polymerase sigma factor (TIGR02999 family)